MGENGWGKSRTMGDLPQFIFEREKPRGVAGLSLRGASDALGRVAWDACKSMMTYVISIIRTSSAKVNAAIFNSLRDIPP